MSSKGAGVLEGRLLLLAPTARDAANGRKALEQAGVACAVCRDLAEVCRELGAGAGAVLLPEEALAGGGDRRLAEALGGQPPWSDLPVLLLTRGGADSPVARRAATLGNVVLLERPVRVQALLSAVRAALRARQRQYEVRRLLAEQDRGAEALREADRRKDEFLAILGHELRNPLSPILTALTVMRQVMPESPLLQQVRGTIERQVGQMARLVDDLLDVSRITRGKFQLQKGRVELRAILERAAETARPLLDSRKHDLTLSLPSGPVWLEADPARLEQVVANLLNNAAKYTDPGGHVWLTAEHHPHEAVVRVRDTGVGIAPGMLPRVFELFSQEDRSLDRAAGGLGIGLTLVKRLVELHGGTVEAASAGLGRGSEFTVRLPVLAALTSPPSANVETTRPHPPSLRVLLVDDMADAADMLGLLLRMWGHEVHVAYAGPPALEAARTFRPDVVLLDIGLPDGMDGYELARRLCEGAGGKKPLLVAMTGYGQEADRQRAAAAGFDHHLVKPIHPDSLEELLARPGPSGSRIEDR
jgi:signal transduction histidine kinase/CheY-like chemotaxis protein